MENKLASPRFLLLTGISLCVLGGLIPIILALSAIGGLYNLRPAQAIALLEKSGETVALVDVRPVVEFNERHVQGSFNLPLDMVLNIYSLSELPLVLQGKTLIMICEAGFNSARAARHLTALNLEACSVRGGLQEWGRDGPRLDIKSSSTEHPPSPSDFALIVDAAGRASVPYQALSQIGQATAAAGLLVIKPAYMVLSLWLVYALVRDKALDMQLVGWGVMFFWLGEVACAIHYTILKDDSYLAEYFHSYGMVLAFSLVTYALFEGLDRRVLHFSTLEKRCAFVELCGLCIKNPAGGLSSVQCGLRRLALLLLPLGALLALIPLSAPLSFQAFNTRIGSIIHFYIRTVIQQLFETRYSPLAAITLFGLAWIVLVSSPRTPLHPLSRLSACGAVGFIGFSYFRTGLGLIYEKNLALATFWEEVTELVFILAVLYVLRVFRRTLLHGPPTSLSWAIKNRTI